MKGDFSRFTFDPTKHYSRVLMQQGRVQLDADWNDQAAMLLHRLETMARDIIGPFGGPPGECAFDIDTKGFTVADFKLTKGRYYVEGVLCENDRDDVTYRTQPVRPDLSQSIKAGLYLAYLDVWEQHVSAIEDPEIRETALGGLDTSGRSKVVWRVGLLLLDPVAINSADPKKPFKDPTKPKGAEVVAAWKSIVAVLDPDNHGRLTVTTDQPPTGDTSECTVPPSSRFRGLENQLYRVEIHSRGTAAPSPIPIDANAPIDSATATFKWSRENGSVVFPVADVSGQDITLERFGADAALGLQIDDWVELVDDDSAHGGVGDLLQVRDVQAAERRVSLKSQPHAIDKAGHPYLRRWDQKGNHLRWSGGAVAVVEGTPLALENGIKIKFDKAAKTTYRAGDFWYIPVRTDGEANIEWPTSVRPAGVDHHYAPLAVLTCDGMKFTDPVTLCVMRFDRSAHLGGD